MLRRIRDRNVWIVYATIFLCGLAGGTAISVLAVFLDKAGQREEIGALAAIFAGGIAVFAPIAGRLVRRFSPRSVLVAALLVYAATLSVFPFVAHSFWLTALDRAIDGAAAAGVWVGCETILLERAPEEDKAFVTSLYALAVAVGYLVGPLSARVVVALASSDHCFWFAAIVVAVGAVVARAGLDRTSPVAARAIEAPGEPTRLAALLGRIKCSLFGTFAYGYFEASVVLFLPLYLVGEKHVTEEQTILVPGFFALGMLTLVVPAARLGDRFGHLGLMRLLGAIGTAMVLAFVALDRFEAMCCAVVMAGATLASISPISLALQGVIVAPADYARANGIYNGCYAAGMLLGPAISGAIFDAAGGPAMLYHLAALWAGFVLMTTVFASDDPRAQRRAAAVTEPS